LNQGPLYIAGMGVISAIGDDATQTLEALRDARCALKPRSLFGMSADQAPVVGAVEGIADSDAVPRTHLLARRAADQALAGCDAPPDAIVLGSTTGGILTTETLLRQNHVDPAGYRHHALNTVAEDLARRCRCTGPLITVSTACSSGAVAIMLAMQMLRRGMARRVLAGGADCLCRLTCFGFKSLQLIDPIGARPLDLQRRGMSVAEGAALVLLTSEPPVDAAVQIVGAGISCDAHHATTPHPEGEGAAAAMRAALDDAGLETQSIDYINLHGTGTRDNDLAEARAIRALFPSGQPLLSSIKGAGGHSLAAAGAIEAVVAALCIQHGLVPANVGYLTCDPDLGLQPVSTPRQLPISTVMSNSFGFGGNNASLILSRSPVSGSAAKPATLTPSARSTPSGPLSVDGFACITGVGHTGETRERFFAGQSCAGCLVESRLAEGLAPRAIRRFKRLSRMALALAVNACGGVPADRMPVAVSMGTAWGALSETHDFLQRLSETDQQFPSPTDFVGSVHNAPAGQIAMLMGAKGANVTASGGDYSFEQALLNADLLTQATDASILVAGADESHAVLSPLLDPGMQATGMAVDGGGALLLRRTGGSGQGPLVELLYYRSGQCPNGMAGLVAALGGADTIRRDYGAVLAGLPAAARNRAREQLDDFARVSRFDGPLIDYRLLTGEFAAASAVATVMGVAMVVQGAIPGPVAGGATVALESKGILMLGLGAFVTAVRISRP
jgi:3-oxoacyl-(acyl-carrier-protein) synthase